MADLFRAGGAPMFFVLILGLVTLLSGGLFVWRPAAHKVKTLQALDKSVMWSALTGLVAALAAVGYHVPADPVLSKSAALPLVILTGIAESMSAPIFGFTFLTLSAVLQSVGLRRLGKLGS